MHESYLNILIKQKLNGLGFSDYHRRTKIIIVDVPDKTILLGSDIYFLNNTNLDIPVTAKLQLESPDNLFITSMIDYYNLNNHKYQSFSESLNISLTNYGLIFIPFQLEFEKVVPTIKHDKHEHKSPATV